MILRFMQRDPAWRFAPWLTAWAAVAALVYPYSEIPLLLAAIAYNCVLVLACYRITSFEVYLPVSGRDLFAGRLLSVLSMIWLPAAAVCASLTLIANQDVTAGEVALIAAVLTLGAIIGLSLRIKQCYPPIGLVVLSMLFVEGIGWAVITLALHFEVPAVGAAICVLAAVALGANAWQSVPEAFQIAPMEPSAARRKPRAAAPVLPWWPIVRTVAPFALGPLILAIVVCSLSWFLGEWSFQVYFLTFFSPFTIANGQQWSLALPLSRRSMLALATVPLLLALVCMSEFGFLTGSTPTGIDLIHLGDPVKTCTEVTPDVFDPATRSEPVTVCTSAPPEIVVDSTFWILATAGRVPAIRAPWGEQAQPTPFRFLGLILYNPYFVGPKNSPQFQAWQVARATTYIYGRPIAPDRLAKVQRRNLIPITAQPRMQILYVAALLAGALIFMWLSEFQLWYRFYRIAPMLRFSLAIAATLAVILIPTAIDLIAGTRDFSRSAVEAVLLAVSRHLPANLLLVTIVAMAPLAVLWRLVERQASVAEVFPTYPSQNCFGRTGSKEWL